MKRRERTDTSDGLEAAQVAQDAAWWAARAALDQPLTLDEYQRFAALTAQRIDVEAALHAILPDVCAPAVKRSRSEHGRAEYQRAAMGTRRPTQVGVHDLAGLGDDSMK